jgi:polysaccharide export outer membrane protein
MFVLLTAAALAQGSAAIQIGPGDRLLLTVHGEPAMGGEFTITEEGLGHVYCGDVAFSGATLEEARERVAACFRDGWLVEPRIGLDVLERKASRIEISGAVGKPGPYYLEVATTLRMAPAMAGGVALERSSGVVVLTRADGQRLEVAVDDLDGPEGSLELRPGDVVRVEQGKTVYVGGEVMKEGPVGYLSGLTALEAVMTAGGPSPLANLAGAWIVRPGADGAKEIIEVNLRRVRKGKDDDPPLRPGDTINVPESPL